MRAVDTNVLVRIFGNDDPDAKARAFAVLNGEEDIFVPTLVVCELGWVLRSVYRRTRGDFALVVRGLLDMERMVMDRDAVQAGLAFLEAGGDFSDGIILYEAGQARCTDVVTFDQKFARVGAPDVVLLS
ncbi:MAG: type II toxin-antitoxin system VapC family toxin [Brevundimonas sp.]|nr:type II toxin-antitoxin system VapC family toxin [Brevundimonas sp.]